MSFTSITQRFVVWFLVIALLPILLIGYSLLHTFEKEMKQTISRQIAVIADKKVDQIEGYLSELARDALIKTQGHTTRLAMSEFAPVFAQDGVESAAYRRLDATYRDYFKRFLNTTGYYDLLLISPQGTVVYSQKNEADFATNLYTGPYRNTALAKMVRNALSTRESGISEFEIYAPSGNAIAAFVAVPIIIEGKLVGVLALQVDKTHMFKVLLDKTGLGDSGETVVAHREDEHTALVVTPLKSDPDASMKHKIPLDGKNRVMAMSRALNSERGSGIAMDYNGQAVVAAWRYLPRMSWGLVVKMDTAEALAPLYRVRAFALAVIGLAIFAALMGALLLGRRVVAPLKGLSNSAQDIAAGKLDQRVPVVGRDELAYLATSFNIMAERLQSSYANLEDLVKQRTVELMQSLERLRIKDAAIASSINAIAIAGLDGKISYVNPAFSELWRLHGPEDALGHPPREFVEKPEDMRAVIDTLQQGGQWQGEMSILRHDGSLATVQLSANMVMDEAGKPACMMGSFVDITARKQAEVAILATQCQLEATIDAIPDLLFELGLDGTYHDVHAQSPDLLAAPAENLLGRKVSDVLTPEAADIVMTALQEAHENGRSHGKQFELVLPGGNLWFELSVSRKNTALGQEPRFIVLSRDITERKQMEQALQQERDFASTLVNTAPMIVLLLDTEGVIEYVNPYFEQLTGYRLDKVKGREWFRTFLPARDQDRIRALFQKAAHDVPTRGNINPILTRNGEELEIEWYSQTMCDAQGKAISVLATGQDVTARRAMERALSASAERLSEAQRIAQVGSWELDLVKGELIWSDEIFRLFEIDKSRFGATYDAFLNAIHPDDRNEVNQAYTRSLEIRAPYEITHRLHMGDGRIKWVHERCETIFDDAGKPLRSMGTVQDITERMQSEVEYQTILKTTMDCFWICSLQGQFLDVNDAYCELIGYSRDELLAMSIPDVEASESADDTKAHIEKVITTGADRFETLHRRKDGNLLNLEVSANFMPDGGGRIVVFLRDISLRKLEEEVLIESRQAAEAANRAKSEFLANMSHEIRTPMNAILGLTQLVLDTELTQRQQDFLRKAHTSAQALLGILNDILDYSKIEAGHMSVEQVPFRLEESLEHVADLFAARIEEKGLELFFEVAPDVPAEILGDPLRLAQVLTNLVGNAVKFTDRGEIHIKVEMVERNASGQRLRFAVRDTGIGLSSAQSSRLFQPFTQADGTTTRKYGGTGLGLSICKRLVGLMGGEIAVSGAEGQGATFTFTIQAGIVASHGHTRDLQQIQGLRTLVVDDQETSRIILQQLLQGWGLEAHAAASGEEALAQIEAAQQSGPGFDVLLLDWHMPGMDGLEVLRRLEQHVAQGRITHPLRVVMVTAHDRQQLLEQAGAIRLNGVLTKPVTPSHLLDALVNCRQPRAVEALTGLRDKAADESKNLQTLLGARVLLVEDNALNRLMAAEFLKRRGAVLTLANHGGEAVEQVKSRTFDAVLMDLHMPFMDGLEATRLIRELPQGKSLPVIAMTAAVMQEDRTRCAAAGMNDFIAKPIDPEDMVRVLLKWVNAGKSKQSPFTFASSPLGERIEERAALIPTFSPRGEGAMVKGAGHDREGWDEGNSSERGDGILPPSLSGFDLEKALQRLDGNRGLLARLLLGFAGEQSDALAQLDALVQAGDSAQAVTLLHTLKGVAANLGAEALAEVARQLEEELKSGHSPVSRQSFADALNAALDAIKTHIAPAQSLAKESVTDREALAQVLNRLVPYLQEQELVPAELMESLYSLVRSNGSDKTLARLMRQVDRFDHDGALASVVQLAAIHGVTLANAGA